MAEPKWQIQRKVLNEVTGLSAIRARRIAIDGSEEYFERRALAKTDPQKAAIVASIRVEYQNRVSPTIIADPVADEIKDALEAQEVV